jgi:hypothetical protein
MTGICLIAGLLLAPLGEAVTLAWTHSIEKIRWEEDYRLENGALRLTEARIRGTGAGMEPPAGAIFRQGVWHYAPQVPPLPRIVLRHSPFATPYEFCNASGCRTAVELLAGLPAEADLVLAPCANDVRK